MRRYDCRDKGADVAYYLHYTATAGFYLQFTILFPTVKEF